MGITRRKPGETIVMRYLDVTRREIFHAAPCRIVVDSVDLVVLFLADGTNCMMAKRLDGGHSVALGPHVLQPTTWHRDLLTLMYPGRAHSISLFWDVAPKRFVFWYVNLEEPFWRTAIGFDAVDHLLDIVIRPDFSWHWKDEDEFSEAVETGLFSSSRADEIRAEGRAVLDQLAKRRAPFNEPWHEWVPDRAWGLPSLPERWDKLPGFDTHSLSRQ